MGVIADYVKKKLEKDIREKGLLIWLDKDDEFSTLADGLIQERAAGRFAYDILSLSRVISIADGRWSGSTIRKGDPKMCHPYAWLQ